MFVREDVYSQSQGRSCTLGPHSAHERQGAEAASVIVEDEVGVCVRGMNMNWQDLVGLVVCAIRWHKGNKDIDQPDFVLFDDGKTFLEFREQDPYDYHDCNSSARLMYIQQDHVMWERIFNEG